MTESEPTGLLIAFVKAPVPGRVKTRLASEVGEARAAGIYQSMAGAAVERLKGGAFRLVVYFDPPEEAPRIRRWIGDDPGTTFLPQPAGDLGTRLRHAFSWGFERADVVCVVGTDIPELTRADVETAIQALTSGARIDVALGPARDGGYYLLGLREPHAELFDAIPWSTDEVLESTLRRAEALGLVTVLLRTLVDVDSPEDLEEMSTLITELEDSESGL